MLVSKLKFKYSYVWAWGHSFMTSAKKIKNSDNPRPVYTTIQFQSDPHSPASLDVLYGFDPPLPKPSMDMMFRSFLQKI